MKIEYRRVVTGLNAQGRSCVIFDGPPPIQVSSPKRPGKASALLWRTSETPVDNSGVADASLSGFSHDVGPGGTAFLMFVQPGTSALAGLDEDARKEALFGSVPEAYRRRAGNQSHPGMHATDTIDYVVIVKGEITLMLEEDEVTLYPGDVIVDRGVAHAWESRGEDGCLMCTVMVDAKPLNNHD